MCSNSCELIASVFIHDGDRNVVGESDFRHCDVIIPCCGLLEDGGGAATSWSISSVARLWRLKAVYAVTWQTLRVVITRSRFAVSPGGWSCSCRRVISDTSSALTLQHDHGGDGGGEGEQETANHNSYLSTRR